MKKLLCLLLSFALIFAFAACGSSKESSDTNSSTAAGAVTSIKFGAESYTVKVDGYLMVSDNITVDPAGAKLVYSVSDDSIVEVSKKGEVYGIKAGTVTLTASSEDGKVSATCTINVAGFGTISTRNENDEGGIGYKEYIRVERPFDTDAFVLIIPKNLASGTDMSGVVSADYGELLSNNSAVKKHGDYYVIKTGANGDFIIEDVPAGDYIGVIFCSYDYYNYFPQGTYTFDKSFDKFKSSEIGKYFTDDQITTFMNKELGNLGKFYQREFQFKNITVTANETAVFEHCFVMN